MNRKSIKNSQKDWALILYM